MASVAVRDEAAAAAVPARTWVDRLLAAVPVASVFLWLCLLYAWESWGHKTPWLFGDELEMAQLSRGIAETGHAMQRGVPASFHSLYTYVVAPAWLFRDTATGYAAAKYIGVGVMASVVFPAYWLARLLVRRPAALVAAAGAGAIPALAYSSMLLPEPLAYPYCTLALFLVAKAILVRRPVWIAAAVAAAAVAPFVRGQLAVVPATGVLAALLMLWDSPRGRSFRSRWSAWDWTGFVVLLVGAVILFSSAMSSYSFSWLVATRLYKGRMLEYGLWAAGALTIGLGVFPIVCGLMSLSRPRFARTKPFRAFRSLFLASLVAFGGYTAVKAAYLSYSFSTLVEERNLIYLAPLFFVATAVWLERPRVRWLALAAATGFAAYLVVSTPYELQFHFYSDAPGLAMVEMLNRTVYMDNPSVEGLLIGMLVLSVALIVGASLARPRWRAVGYGAASLAAVLAVAWNVAGEVSAARASNSFSHDFVVHLPPQLDWLDRLTGDGSAVYLGQNVQDPNGVYQLEFWNRSLKHVWSLDGTAPPPGPILTPDLVKTDGTLTDPHVDYVVAGNGVDVAAPVVPSADAAFVGLTLYRLNGPLRLRSSTTGIFTDGWAGADSAYTRYAGKGPGVVSVVLDRTAWCGTDVPGHATIEVGRVAIDHGEPALGSLTAVRRWTIHACKRGVVPIPTPAPPFRVQVHVDPTFAPQQLDPRVGDARQLSARISFDWRPRSH